MTETFRERPTDGLNSEPSPADAARALAAVFGELETVLRNELRNDIEALILRGDNQLRYLDELQRRTDELAEKLGAVTLALLEADAAIIRRVENLERLADVAFTRLPRPRRWKLRRGA